MHYKINNLICDIFVYSHFVPANKGKQTSLLGCFLPEVVAATALNQGKVPATYTMALI
jgi:hypothetical protein